MKVLVIRFSSIGDVTQALSIPAHIRSRYPQAEIHFLTKTGYMELLKNNPHIHRVWTLPSEAGIAGLFKIARQLNAENFDSVYDAHNNLRSNVIYFLVRAKNKIQKPMHRWKRFLLLKFKINRFEKPFSGQRDLLRPLEKWEIPLMLPASPQLFIDDVVGVQAQALLAENKVPSDFIVVAPSAAHEFKRWPIEKWKELFASTPEQTFVVLAGKNDLFTQEFNPFSNVVNLTGMTSLLESAAIIQRAHKMISNDTGLLHMAEQLGTKAVALIGAAPFGFPSRNTTHIIQKKLSCWPCSKHGQGPCVNSIYHRCMKDILVSDVKRELESL